MKCRVHDRERGMTIAMVALFIVALFVIAALAVDVGMLYTARTSAQHSADAAALAGAFTFVDQATAPQPSTAQNAAIATAAQNKILGQAVNIAAGDVVVDQVARTVTVTVSRTGNNAIATFFARVIGINTADVAVKATAQAATQGSGGACVKPFFMPNTVLSSLSTIDACKAGQKLLNPDGSMTAWAISQGFGQSLQLRPTTPSGALTPSQYYSLDFGSGANTFRCTIGQCLNECGVSNIKCGDSWPVETGNMVGPTNQGVDELIGNPPDQWISLYQYRDSGGNISDTSKSLVSAPVWDNCSQTINPGTAGQKITINGFMLIFVDGMKGSTLNAHLVSETGCNTVGGVPGSGPFTIPVRLVQTP